MNTRVIKFTDTHIIQCFPHGVDNWRRGVEGVKARALNSGKLFEVWLFPVILSGVCPGLLVIVPTFGTFTDGKGLTHGTIAKSLNIWKVSFVRPV